MKDKEHPLSDTIKSIDETFNALATDIVANEGRDIYAKNKLGMSDTVEAKNENTNLNYDLTLNLNSNCQRSTIHARLCTLPNCYT